MSCLLAPCFRMARVGPSVIDLELEYRRDHARHNFKIAMLGKEYCGRHTLSWSLKHLGNPSLPPRLLRDAPRRRRTTVTVGLNDRRELRVRGEAVIQVGYVPPEVDHDGVSFFSRRGDIHRCDALIFCVDIGDQESAVHFNAYAIRCFISRIPFLSLKNNIVVGNKSDLRRMPNALRNFHNIARRHQTRGYIECSAWYRDGVGRVLDALLQMLFGDRHRY